MAEDTHIEADNPVDEFTKQGKERLKDPFYFSLVVSFAAINWKAIYFLLWPSGEYDAEARLNYIAGNLYNETFWYVMKVFVGPIFFACLYVGILPHALRGLYAMRHTAERLLEKRKAKIDEGVTKIKLKVELLGEELDKQKQENQNLNQRIGELQNEIETNNKALPKQIEAGIAEALKGTYKLLGRDRQVRDALDKVARHKWKAVSHDLRDSMQAAGFIGPLDGHYLLTEAGVALASEMNLAI